MIGSWVLQLLEARALPYPFNTDSTHCKRTRSGVGEAGRDKIKCIFSGFYFCHQRFLRENDSSILDREVEMSCANMCKFWKMLYFNPVPPEVIFIYLKLPINLPAKENTHTPLHKWL